MTSAPLVWDQVGSRLYETGTSKGVLFVQGSTGTYNEGVAWNGLVAVKQSNDGAAETPLYADNIKYVSMFSAENLKGSIDAFTYPEEFETCDGSANPHPGLSVGQQNRSPFGLAYSTIVGNDTQGNAYGEKLHLIYNARVSPSSRDYSTVNDSPSALTFSWNFTTTPVDLSANNLTPAAGITIDKTKVSAAAWTSLTDALYGSATAASRLPSISEVITMCASA
jgi:hypothetical protein